jgi:hypothetical protein
MRGIGTPDRSNVLTVGFEDVFTPLWPSHHQAAVVRLNEHVPRAGPLYIIDDLGNRATLTRSDAGMVAAGNP